MNPEASPGSGADANLLEGLASVAILEWTVSALPVYTAHSLQGLPVNRWISTIRFRFKKSKVLIYSLPEQAELYLGVCTSVFLPFFAVTIVLFPLLAGRGGAVSVIMVKAIPQAFTMFEFTPVVITGARRLLDQRNRRNVIRTHLDHSVPNGLRATCGSKLMSCNKLSDDKRKLTFSLT